MICTVARLVFEYVERHTREATEQNLLAKTIRCVTKCVINMLYCCLRYLTQYAYIYIAVIGEAFVPSACKSFQLFAKYPAQACATALMILAFIVTHMAIGVYDVVVTSLLICAMRDEEHCGAQYMSESLRRAAGFDRREIEFSS
eukprot:g27889.t1